MAGEGGYEMLMKMGLAHKLSLPTPKLPLDWLPLN